jgi:hypothetical protein
MTQSIPSEHNSEKESVSTTTEQKRFLDLSSIEIEQLVLKATTQAKKRMHDKGISVVACKSLCLGSQKLAFSAQINLPKISASAHNKSEWTHINLQTAHKN